MSKRVSYLNTMRSLWTQQDLEALKHRVGYKQFTDERCRWYQEKITKHQPLGDRILEYGCGVGRQLNWMASRNAKSAFHGLDISPTMIESAKVLARADGLDNVRYGVVNGDGFQVVEKYTTIYSIICWQHICDLDILTDIANSMVEHVLYDGQIVVQVKKWREGLRPYDYKVPMSGMPTPVDLPTLPRHFHVEEGNAWTTEQLTSFWMARGCDVTIEESEAIDDHGSWLWAYAKKRL